MRKTEILLPIALAVTLILLTQIVSAESKSSAEESWIEQMKSFKTTLGDLLPLAASANSFNDPNNAVTIQSKINRLSDVRNLLRHSLTVSSSDPTMAYIASAFDQNVSVINQSLKAGRRDYARYLLLNTASYCIECHTRTNEQPEFFGSKLTGLVGMLGPIERTEYLIATRKFKEALSTIEETFSNGLPKEMSLNADKLIRYALAVSIKYYEDPELTLKFIGIASRSKDLPTILNRDLTSWRDSVKDWKVAKTPSTKAAEKYLDFIEQLIKKGNSSRTRNESQHAGDIYFLRAYAMANSFLKTNPSKKNSARALMFMGDSYEDVTDSLFWTLPRYYFEACIRLVPHSVQAIKCYQKFEEATRVAYSAGSGIVPLDVLQHLKELQVLSIHP